MRSKLKRSTISTKPSLDIKSPNIQHKNPQDWRLQAFLLKKDSINNNVVEYLHQGQTQSIRNSSKDSKKSVKKKPVQEFFKDNILKIRVQRKSSIQSVKCVHDLQPNQIEEKYERDPFMRAKIQSFIRENSANKRQLNTYKVSHAQGKPKTLKEKLDLTDFEFYSKYEKIRQKMGVS